MSLAPLIIVSGPSGSGKSTLIQRLLEEKRWPLRLSVSVTTRPPRPRETPGINYYYWTRNAFQSEVAAGGFLEWAEVFGNYYGTLESEVSPYLQQGVGVILDIDVQGSEQVKARFQNAVAIFVRTSTMDVLEERLRGRKTESAQDIERRLAGARRELARAGDYDYQVINDDLETAHAELRAILEPLFERTSDAR